MEQVTLEARPYIDRVLYLTAAHCIAFGSNWDLMSIYGPPVGSYAAKSNRRVFHWEHAGHAFESR